MDSSTYGHDNRRLELAGQPRDEEVDLGREVPVQRAERHVRLIGNRPHPDRVIAALGGQDERGIQDPAAPVPLRR